MEEAFAFLEKNRVTIRPEKDDFSDSVAEFMQRNKLKINLQVRFSFEFYYWQKLQSVDWLALCTKIIFTVVKAQFSRGKKNFIKKSFIIVKKLMLFMFIPFSSGPRWVRYRPPTRSSSPRSCAPRTQSSSGALSWLQGLLRWNEGEDEYRERGRLMFKISSGVEKIWYICSSRS